MAISREASGGGAWFPKKVLLLSTGVLSAAMLLKLSAPSVLEFAVSDAPLLYRGALAWLRPPYLYLLINCIIISIVASSKLQPKSDEDGDETPPEVTPLPRPPAKIATDYAELDGVVSSGYGIVTAAPPEVVEDVIDEAVDTETPEMKFIDDEATVAIEDSSSTEIPDPPQRSDSMELSTIWNDKENEKPPVSSRFAQRKALKSNLEGKGLRRVTKPKRQDTLENTWRTITEGRGMPLARHLKKSDTWRNDPDPNPDPTVKKSETLRERGGEVSGKVRKEPSLSQEELNRRVEEFINKFNEEMRLQRQESLNQYQEMMMMGRGGH